MNYLFTILTIASMSILAGIGYDAHRPSASEMLLDEAWEYVCNVDRTFNCDGVEKPELIQHDGLNADKGTYGFFYSGEAMIFAQKTTRDQDKLRQTVVHELVHYLQDQSGYFESKVHSCDWEAGAFAVADRYANYIKRPDLIRGDTWWVRYRQCQHLGD